MTPAANLLLTLAGQVTNAERQLEQGPLYWANSKVQSVTRDLAEGNAMNSLGELQGTAAGFDAAVVRLETSAEAFTTAFRIFGTELMNQAEDDWLQQMINDSPRLATIQRKLVVETP